MTNVGKLKPLPSEYPNSFGLQIWESSVRRAELEISELWEDGRKGMREEILEEMSKKEAKTG